MILSLQRQVLSFGVSKGTMPTDAAASEIHYPFGGIYSERNRMSSEPALSLPKGHVYDFSKAFGGAEPPPILA